MVLHTVPVIFLSKFDLSYKPVVTEYLYDNNLQISFSFLFLSNLKHLFVSLFCFLIGIDSTTSRLITQL